MVKELLKVEFRYHDRPNGEHDGGHRTKTVTIGIYDTLDEAILEGNKTLETLSDRFEVRGKFVLNHLFGHPKRLVTNTCYPTKGIEYFASIVKLSFDDLTTVIGETFDAHKRYFKSI